MRLPLDADQAAFDAWEQHHKDKATDYLGLVDLNDMKMVWAVARKLATDHPESREKLLEVTPEAVERAGNELGMFMGASYLAKQAGLEPKVGSDAMTKLVRGL